MLVSPPPVAPPAAPPPPEYDSGKLFVGVLLAFFAGAFTALSMVINRYSLAHAGPRKVSLLGRECTVKPWMVWICAMALYNLGATVLASIAQLFMPLSLFAALFILLLVWNLILARFLIREKLTCPKVLGAALIIVGAAMTSIGAPPKGTQLQEHYRCTDDEATEPPAACVYVLVEDLGTRPEAIAWMATLLTLTLASVAAIILMECTYPASAKFAAARAVEPVVGEAVAGEPVAEVAGSGGKAAPPRLAPPWLERVMTFVYPASMGVDEGIAHLWMRAETAMTTQCVNGGCDNGSFAAAVSFRWSASIATAFWLVVVFRRYEATVALPIEYGTATVVDVASSLIFYREYEIMEHTWQAPLVVSGCAVCVVGIAIGLIEPGSARVSCVPQAQPPPPNMAA